MTSIENSDDIENKPKSKVKSVVIDIFKDYCSNTSIHGIGYLGADDKTYIEKLWWFIILAISLLISSVLIMNTWTKWKEQPVVVTFSTRQNSVWEIPFPAVTVCPYGKINSSKYDYSHEYERRFNLTEDEKKKFLNVALVCESVRSSLPNGSRSTNENIIKHIKEVTPDVFKTITNIKFGWQVALGRKVNNSELLFVPQLTSEGVCFTFNSLAISDMYTNQMETHFPLVGHNKITSYGWNVEDGFSEDTTSYPLRSAAGGMDTGLRFFLISETKYSGSHCGDSINAFKITLQTPIEGPRLDKHYILAPVNRQVIISVIPKQIKTSEGLLSISPEIRQCYFANEKKLRYFKVYSQSNCKLECTSNITKLFCKCVPFYLPRDRETFICGFNDMLCYKFVMILILSFEKSTIITRTIAENNIYYKTFRNCTCLPSCASLDYEFHTSQAEYESVQSILLRNEELLKKNTTIKTQHTEVKIFFPHAEYIALYRTELFGQTDFLANIGGLLGLFMGISFLSVLEIIYFITLRLYCKLYK